MYYREDKAGQILQEGINEAGGMSSWIAAATSYSTNNRIMIPFYIYYSMFGLQRVGDLCWAAGDMQARGFLLGGTSGRTTLNGEGLQHEDGHSHVLASTIPNCVSYDPTFAHEVGVIMHHGLKRMVERQENVFYYLTLLNENYPMPGLKAGTEEQIIKGMYLLQEGAKKTPRVNLLGSGTILRESMAAKELLEQDWGVAANVWSCPSFNELARDGQDCERWNLLHPNEQPRVPFVTQQLAKHAGPVVASTDYIKNYCRPDPRLHAQGPHVQGARHRRLRPQRLPQQAARALRGQSPLHRGGRAEGAGRRGRGASRHRRRGDREVPHQARQDQPAVRLKNNDLAETSHANGGSAGPRHWGLQGRGRHRVAGQARRHGQGGTKPDHRGERQGLDGNSSSSAGVVKEIKVTLGDKVSEGSLLLVLDATGDAAAAAPPAAAAAPAVAPPRRYGRPPFSKL